MTTTQQAQRTPDLADEIVSAVWRCVRTNDEGSIIDRDKARFSVNAILSRRSEAASNSAGEGEAAGLKAAIEIAQRHWDTYHDKGQSVSCM